jgi:hypothetical protein
MHKITRQAELLLLFLLITSHCNTTVTFWYIKHLLTEISYEIIIHAARNILQQTTQDQNFKTEMTASKGKYVKRFNYNYYYYKEINITASHRS